MYWSEGEGNEYAPHLVGGSGDITGWLQFGVVSVQSEMSPCLLGSLHFPVCLDMLLDGILIVTG